MTVSVMEGICALVLCKHIQDVQSCQIIISLLFHRVSNCNNIIYSLLPAFKLVGKGVGELDNRLIISDNNCQINLEIVVFK